jgi:tetratricopeptide (TPR) repeat protein
VGEYAEASALAERALSLSEKTDDFRGVAWAHWVLAAVAYLGRREFEKALEHMKYEIQMGQESGGFQHEVAAALVFSAEALLRLGRYEEALGHCQQCLAISLKPDNKLESGKAFRVLAEIHASEPYRDWGKVDEYLAASLKALREAGNEVFLAELDLSKARIALLRNDGTARQWAETARGIFEERGAKAYLRDAEELLATIP